MNICGYGMQWRKIEQSERETIITSDKTDATKCGSPKASTLCVEWGLLSPSPIYYYAEQMEFIMHSKLSSLKIYAER